MMRTVLVTGARAPVAIDIAHAFARAGHSTWLADSVTPHAAKWSTVGRGRIVSLPPARHAFGDYRTALRVWLRNHPSTLVVPTCEEVFYLSEAAARDGYAGQVFAPPPEVLRRLHSKIEFPAWARSLGIPAPETQAVTSASDVAATSTKHGPALVLKPEFSRFGTATLVGPRPSELSAVAASVDCRWAAQHRIEGEEICLWTAAREGSLVAGVAYRPKWRLGRSASFAFEAMDCPAALEVARTIARAGRITGQLAFDIILTARGEAVPIECNPRAISGVHLFCGRAALAEAILGDGPPAYVTEGFVYLAPAMFFLGVPQALRHASVRRWWSDLRRGSDAITAISGWRGGVGTMVDAARFSAIALSRSRSPTRQTTDDIEWNGEAMP